MEAYDKYWDTIRTERTLIADAEERGKIEGELIGIQKEKIYTILNSFDNDLSIDLISNITNLSEDEIINILKQNNKL